MSCCPPGSSVCGIFQARILEWVAVSSSRGSFCPRDWTHVTCVTGRFFTCWTILGNSLVIQLLGLHSMGQGSIPGGGNKILKAAWHGQKTIKRKKHVCDGCRIKKTMHINTWILIFTCHKILFFSWFFNHLKTLKDSYFANSIKQAAGKIYQMNSSWVTHNTISLKNCILNVSYVEPDVSAAHSTTYKHHRWGHEWVTSAPCL